ncbi:MAG: hypothetical protein HOB73_10980 [Planctomycetaceae bacterium]|nr:hypothetical protein [Planctomycetaceae bacterium]
MSTIDVTCPHCNRQMNFPAAAAGNQGKCGGCQQIVMIQPDPLAVPSAPPLPPPIKPEGAHTGKNFPTIPGLDPNASTKSRRPAASKKKLIIFASAGCGVLVVLGVILLAAILVFAYWDDGIDQSSPEALGKTVFNTIVADDEAAFISLMPDAKFVEDLIFAAAKYATENGGDTEEAERIARMLDYSELTEQLRDKLSETFRSAVNSRNWGNASLVTVVSGRLHKVDPFSMCKFSFVIFELDREMYVLVIQDSVMRNDDWHLNDDNLRTSRLSDMRSDQIGVLRAALQRSDDPNQTRVLRELRY